MWFRLQAEFIDHPKMLRAGERAGWAYIRSLAWSTTYQTDGFIPASAVALLCRGSDCSSTLVEAGLWEETEGGFQIHDWSQYQPPSDYYDVMRERRSEAGKKGAAKRWSKRTK